MAKIGRNEPCPCASGKKYKRCCLGTPRDPVRKTHVQPHWNLNGLFPPVPEDLKARVDEVHALLEKQGLVHPSEEDRELEQEAFEQACLERWSPVALEPEVFALCEQARAVPERKSALPLPSCVQHLMSLGESGVHALGVLLQEDAWCSILAIEALVGMPPGPLRDRAVVEGLFVRGDWVPNRAIQQVETWPEEQAWPAFETVVRNATEDGVELQSIFWTGLFELNHRDLSQPLRPSRRFGEALVLLYDSGHHGAVADALRHVLDASFAGEESARAFLADHGFQQALAHIRASYPGNVREDELAA